MHDNSKSEISIGTDNQRAADGNCTPSHSLRGVMRKGALSSFKKVPAAMKKLAKYSAAFTPISVVLPTIALAVHGVVDPVGGTQAFLNGIPTNPSLGGALVGIDIVIVDAVKAALGGRLYADVKKLVSRDEYVPESAVQP
jgi:hypothetical protein